MRGEVVLLQLVLTAYLLMLYVKVFIYDRFGDGAMTDVYNKRRICKEGTKTRLDDLELPKKLKSKLANNGYKTLGDISNAYDFDIVIYECRLNRKEVKIITGLLDCLVAQ